LIGYSLITDHAFGLVAVLSFKTHRLVDLAAAGAFVGAPFFFGWSGLVMGYYLVMAAGVIVLVALTNLNPAGSPDTSASTGMPLA
jgi:hypothetical protein